MSIRLRLLFLAGTLTVASLTRAHAEPLVFLPPLGPLGALMHTHAEHMLVEANAGAVVGLRQILAVAETLNLAPEALSDANAARLAVLVGAKRFVVARLVGKGPYELELHVVENGQAGPKQLIALPRTSAAAVNAGAEALAKAVLGRAVPPTDTLPSDMKDDAVESYARCTTELLRQAIALDSPVPLRTDDLERSIKACRETIALYPQLDDARAKLGLALALSNHAQEAVDLLRTIPTKRYEPSLWIAHYWLETRHKSTEAGLAVLQEVVKRFPSSLLARAFLADHLFAMRRYAEALVVANAIVELVPDSATPRARVSAILGRLGRNDEALKMAEDVAKRAPQDERNLTTLASRYLDAARYADALATLAAVERPSARVFNLRGWASLRLGKLDDAQRAFETAGQMTEKTRLDWRTRGRVLAGLLRVAAARSDAKATAQIAEIVRVEGFVAFLRALEDPAVTSALDRAQMPKTDAAVGKQPGVGGPRFIRPRDATPFNLDPVGEVDPKNKSRITPPNQLELLRF